MKNWEKTEKMFESFEDLYSFRSRKLFDLIEKLQEKAFLKNGPLHKYKESVLLDKLIEYFESTEEYEKCSILSKTKRKIK
jgi:hypothetical protein